jgi:hypothetical protein
VVTITGPYGRILGFLDQPNYKTLQSWRSYLSTIQSDQRLVTDPIKIKSKMKQTMKVINFV